jgi:predicted dehydrogenase
MLEIGLVGCGAVVHSNYAKTLRSRDAYAVRYVCDTSAEQARSAAGLFGAEVVDLEVLAERSDAVVVSTPPTSHAELVRKCLRTGVTILCEKPFVTRHSEAEELVSTAANTDAQLYVGHFRRAFPQLELARDLIALGVIGRVESFAASEGGRFTWESTSRYTIEDSHGGVLWDTGSHTLDMALYAANLDDSPGVRVEPLQVLRDKPEPSHHFSAKMRLQFDEQEVVGLLRISRVEALPNFVSIRGDRGSITFVVGLDDRVRLTTPHGSQVLRAQRTLNDLMEAFDVQVRAVFTRDRANRFAAASTLAQIRILEVLSDAY